MSTCFNDPFEWLGASRSGSIHGIIEVPDGDIPLDHSSWEIDSR